MRAFTLILVVAASGVGQPAPFSRPVAAHADLTWAWPAWSPLTVRALARTGPVTFPDARLIADVRFGDPAGPATTTGLPAPTSPLVLTAGMTASGAWVVPAGTAPGVYWMRIHYSDALGITYDEYVCGQVFGVAGGAFLSRTTTPTLGGNAAFLLSDTTSSGAGAPYQAALSFTSNTGIPALGTTLALDPDELFSASWPHPIAEFMGFQGTLDAMGDAMLHFAVPNVPLLSGVPFRIQAVVLDPVTGLRLSSPNGYVLQ